MAKTGAKTGSILVRLADRLHRLRRGRAEVVSGRELQPVPEPAPPAPSASPRPVVLVTAFGLAGRALEEVLELVTKESESTSVTPVFVTDSLDFAPFRRRRLRFEYLPDRGTQQRLVPDLDRHLYERRRYLLLREKWQTRSLISFGRSPPPECVAAIRQSETEEASSGQAPG